MKYLSIFSLIALFTLSACENLLIKELELEDVGFEKQLVLQSTIEAGVDSVIVFVSENESILEIVDNIEYIKDADVRIYHEGSEIAKLVQENAERYYFYFENPISQSGDYQVVVTDTKYGETRASTEIPEAVEISDIKFRYNIGFDPLDQSSISEISFTLNDPPGKNYYIFETFSVAGEQDTLIFGNDTTFFEPSVYLYPAMSLDPNMEIFGFSDKIILNDEAFDGRKYLVKVRYNANYNIWTDMQDDKEVEEKMRRLLRLRFETHSEDSFLHTTSIEKYRSGGGFGLFSEPITIHSNVENGLGIFAGVNGKTYKVD